MHHFCHYVFFITIILCYISKASAVGNATTPTKESTPQGTTEAKNATHNPETGEEEKGHMRAYMNRFSEFIKRRQKGDATEDKETQCWWDRHAKPKFETAIKNTNEIFKKGEDYFQSDLTAQENDPNADKAEIKNIKDAFKKVVEFGRTLLDMFKNAVHKYTLWDQLVYLLKSTPLPLIQILNKPKYLDEVKVTESPKSLWQLMKLTLHYLRDLFKNEGNHRELNSRYIAGVKLYLEDKHVDEDNIYKKMTATVYLALKVGIPVGVFVIGLGVVTIACVHDHLKKKKRQKQMEKLKAEGKADAFPDFSTLFRPGRFGSLGGVGGRTSVNNNTYYGGDTFIIVEDSDSNGGGFWNSLSSYTDGIGDIGSGDGESSD